MEKSLLENGNLITNMYKKNVYTLDIKGLIGAKT